MTQAAAAGGGSSGGSGGDPAAADAAVRGAFERAVARAWPRPVPVLADALYIVREVRPYMHLFLGPRGGPPGEDAGCVAARFPYGAEAAGGEGAAAR